MNDLFIIFYIYLMVFEIFKSLSIYLKSTQNLNTNLTTNFRNTHHKEKVENRQILQNLYILYNTIQRTENI